MFTQQSNLVQPKCFPAVKCDRTLNWLHPQSPGEHARQLRRTAVLGSCHTVRWCLGNIFRLTVWSDVEPGPGRRSEPGRGAAKHKPANSGNDRCDGFKPGRGVINHQWGILYYVTIFSIAILIFFFYLNL